MSLSEGSARIRCRQRMVKNQGRYHGTFVPNDQNVRSLRHQLSVVRSEASMLKKYEAIRLTETWLNNDVATAELQVGRESRRLS